VPGKGVPEKPEYDYKCEGCGHSFTVSLGIKKHDMSKIKCPKCKSAKARQKITTFAVTTKRKS
jgi:putative FmdB family regulatory protein